MYPDGTDYKIRMSLPTGEVLDESEEPFAIKTPAGFVPEIGLPTEAAENMCFASGFAMIRSRSPVCCGR